MTLIKSIYFSYKLIFVYYKFIGFVFVIIIANNQF
jgi:hypothetical protein